MTTRDPVLLSAFGIRDIPDARRACVIRDRDGAAFSVVRLAASSRKGFFYHITTPTGMDIANTLAGARRIIRNAR